MRIQATGPGRRGTLDQGVCKLYLSDAKEYEQVQLKALYEEIQDGHFGFWTPIMWAMRNGLTTDRENKMLDKIIDRIGPKFKKACESAKPLTQRDSAD